ncbi:hypothetical protein [Chryseobacterium terrae]|uniref:Lipoprotein n=1 Tax=Chryseobacterium terrae TaxID=3163299 RepID=A0ABW8Y487_9FLAO
MKKTYKILIMIIFSLISFISGTIYCSYINKKFYDSNIGMTLKENRKVWGKPDKIDINRFEIVDTYRSILPLNKYKFFYKIEDSIMIRSWKEY